MMLHAAIYRLALGAYTLAIRIAALFNHKAKLFAHGRKNGIATIRAALSGDNRPRIWMHCASLGEFEQGRPVLEALRAQHPQYAILLTFFSPSGYEVRKDYKGADHVFYLPMDSPKHAKEFLDIVKPCLCIFIKYEFWYYYLFNISARKIPAILVSAKFTKEQGFFKWYGGLQREMLRCFTHIFVQDENSKLLLENINIRNVTVSGDTRFDRVINVAAQAERLPIAAAFSQGHKVIVAGSTWKEDEQFLHTALSFFNSSHRLILVPHEVDNEHIDKIEKLFSGNTVRWSQWQEGNDKHILLVDKVGLLSTLYKYGNIAWIGGGFGKEGVHNVLEAAVYGIPCYYGPIFHQFIEAQELIQKGGAATVTEPMGFVTAIQQLEDNKGYQEMGRAAKEYVLSGAGATGKVMGFIDKTL